jgi:dCMP deaminase
MFIAIVGTPSSGKNTILDYLIVTHGFERIGLSSPKDVMAAARVVSPASAHAWPTS